VTLWTDGGGKVKASTLRPVQGRGKVARLINAVAARPSGQDFRIRHRTVNGDPSALLFAGDAPFAVMVLDLSPDGDKVSGIYAVTNPDKLTRVQTHEDEGGQGDEGDEP
jgi:RNA polymerase sigma-70 factor (ECF subfamily)